jgi:hypothetical protein
MKISKVNRKKYFSELLIIEDFTTIEDVIFKINEHFLDEGYDADDSYYTDNENGIDYKYCYMADDGDLTFVEDLNEFSEYRNTLDKWVDNEPYTLEEI